MVLSNELFTPVTITVHSTACDPGKNSASTRRKVRPRRKKMIQGSKITAWLTDTSTPSKLNIPAAPTHSEGLTASSAPAYPIPNATTPTSKAASKNKRGRMRESYKKRKEDGAASLPLPVTPCSAT